MHLLAMVVIESFVYLQSCSKRRLHQLQQILIKTTSCPGFKDILSMNDWTKSVLWLLLGSPIPALIYCLYTAYTSDQYAIRARTWCGKKNPPNFAISVSEATSNPDSARYAWTLGILLHVYPRLFQGNMIFKTFNDSLQQRSNVFQYAWWYSWIYIDW